MQSAAWAKPREDPATREHAMELDPAQRVKDLRAALDAFTNTIPEPSRQNATRRLRTEWRHVRMSGITALLHGDFQLASRMYAACHAATRISVIIDETETGDSPDADGAAQSAQAAAGCLIKEFETVADHLQMSVTKLSAGKKPQP